MGGLVLFDDAVDAVALCRVEDAAAAEPERNVCRIRLPVLGVADQIAWLQVGVGDGRARLLLLVGVARNQATGATVGHMDEAGAVDAAFRHPAPEVRRAEVATRLPDGLRR